MTKIFFSPSRIGFYPESDREVYESAGSWPEDAVSVSQEVWLEFTGSPPEGKMIGVTKQGAPKWVDPPQPGKEELVMIADLKKEQLMNEASMQRGILQDAMDEGYATEEEIKLLSAWKIYRVALNRIDTLAAPDIKWPDKPV